MQQLFMPLDTTVKRDGGDGQVTLGEQVIMKQARKVRRLYEGKVLWISVV